MIRGDSLTKDILITVAAAPILLAVLIAPNTAQILEPLIGRNRSHDKLERRRIYEAIKRLNQKRLINLTEKNGDIFIEITAGGKKLVKSFDYDGMKLPRPAKWDRKWRLVIFDIPEKKQKTRHAFSRRLKEIGFYPLQESVFAYPHDCRAEIDFMCHFLNIDKYVNYLVIEDLDKREGDLCKFFNLKIL